MDFHELLQTLRAIPAGFERIFPNRLAAVQAVFNDSYVEARLVDRVFENTRPSRVKWKPLAGVGDDPEVRESP
jgi:hypothetical protein